MLEKSRIIGELEGITRVKNSIGISGVGVSRSLNCQVKAKRRLKSPSVLELASVP